MTTLAKTEEKLIKLCREMYELTEPECRCSCKYPQSCCSPEYCGLAVEWALEEWGIVLKLEGRLLPLFGKGVPSLLGPKGCLAAPHRRLICTLHTCDVNDLGFKRGDSLRDVHSNSSHRIGQMTKLVKVGTNAELLRGMAYAACHPKGDTPSEPLRTLIVLEENAAALREGADAIDEVKVLRGHVKDLEDVIRKIHDAVARSNQSKNHDFSGCALDGVLSLAEKSREDAEEIAALRDRVDNLRCEIIEANERD